LKQCNHNWVLEGFQWHCLECGKTVENYPISEGIRRLNKMLDESVDEIAEYKILELRSKLSNLINN
jgi:hypothetical protein